MSKENVEAIRRSFALFLSGDREAWAESFDPDIGWDITTHPLPDVPNRGRGRDAFMTEMMATYLSGWKNYSSELIELIDAANQVIAVIHETAEMRNTGVALDRNLIQVWTMRDGRATFLRVFKTKDEALEAVGLSE